MNSPLISTDHQVIKGHKIDSHVLADEGKTKIRFQGRKIRVFFTGTLMCSIQTFNITLVLIFALRERF